MTAGTITPNLFDRLAAAFGRTTKAAPPPPGALYPSRGMVGAMPLAFPGWAEYLRDYGDGAANGRDEQNAKRAASSPWVFRGVQAIANEISTSTVVVQRRVAEGDEDVENHPFEVLWEKPNPFMGRALLMQLWTWQILLAGEAYLFLRPVGGRLAEIWPVPSWTIRPIPHPQQFIAGYVFQADSRSEPTRIDPRYICYSRLPNPFDIRRGLSPLAALMTEIDGDLGMARWNANFFSKENAAPEGLITVPRDTLDEDLTRVRQEMADFFSSGARRVAVARMGDLDWKPFGRSQKDMEFLAGRGFTASLIDTVLGIPEGYFAKDATRANSEGAKATFIENAVWPRLTLLSEDLNAQVMPLWYAADERATFDDIRPRNRTLELQEFGALQAVLTVNELRQRYDYEPLPDPRGEMLPKEVEKGQPMPATPASDATEAAIAAMEAEAEPEAPPPAEDLAEDGAAEAPPLEEGAPDEEALKAAERRAWERKALRKGAAVKFAPQHLDAAEASAIRARLAEAQDAAAIKAAFKAAPVDVLALIDAEWGAAVTWAKKAMEGE